MLLAQMGRGAGCARDVACGRLLVAGLCWSGCSVRAEEGAALVRLRAGASRAQGRCRARFWAGDADAARGNCCFARLLLAGSGPAQGDARGLVLAAHWRAADEAGLRAALVLLGSAQVRKLLVARDAAGQRRGGRRSSSVRSGGRRPRRKEERRRRGKRKKKKKKEERKKRKEEKKK